MKSFLMVLVVLMLSVAAVSCVKKASVPKDTETEETMAVEESSAGVSSMPAGHENMSIEEHKRLENAASNR